MKPSKSPISCSLINEHRLMQENMLIQNERITQVYVIQSEENPFHWFGVLFVDSGLYMGTVVRFSMKLRDSYPDCPCPRIFFEPIPYHPLVSPETGELDTKNAFPDWDSNTHKLFQLLLFTKRVFKQANEYIIQIQALLSSSPNQMIDHSTNEAQKHEDDDDDRIADLFMFFDHTLRCIRTYETNLDEFKLLIDNFKHICYQHLFSMPRIFESDKNALLFSDWNPQVHEPLRNCILANKFTPEDVFASYHKETDSVTFIPGLDRS